MKTIHFIFAGMAVVASTACTLTPPAPGKSGVPIIDKTAAGRNAESSTSAEVVKPKTPVGKGYYAVQKGDTLYRIAQEFGVSWQDLVGWNNLADPNDIKIDQVLRIAPPQGSALAGKPQTSSVAAAPDIEVRPVPPVSEGHTPSHKTGPRGDKRPYSDAAMSEMEKSDAAKNAVPRNNDANNGDKRSDDAGIAWIWPAEGRVISGFSSKKKGIDIAGELGQPVFAAGPGTVQYASSIRGYGNVVIVKHNNNLLSAYAHNKTILVKEGQTVRQGQQIAEMGNTDTDRVKLHFEIRQQGKPVDPTKFLPGR